LNRSIVASLRVRLLGIVAVALLPALVFMALSAVEVRTRLADNSLHELARVADFAASEQSHLVRSAELALEQIGDGEWVDTLNFAACSALAADAVRAEASFLNIGALDPVGMLQCSALPFDAPLDLSDRAYFKRALAEGRFVSGGSQVGLITNRPTVNYAAPVIDRNGTVLAVLFVAVDLDWIERFVVKEGLAPGTVIDVLDGSGRIMGRFPDQERWVGRAVADEPLVRSVLAQRHGTVESVGLDGVRRMYGFSPLAHQPAGLDGFVAVGYLPETVFGEVDTIFIRNLVLMMVTVLCGLVAAWIFIDWAIVKPVQILGRTAHRLAAGDLQARPGARRAPGELGQLQQAFDEMAAALEVHQEHIRRTEERLRQSEKMEAVGRLAGGIAHDFNNLLTAIIGFSTLLQDRLAGAEPEHTYLDEIAKAGERAAQLTNQLLIFSRQQVVRAELVDLNDVVRDMGNLLRRVIGEDVRLDTVLAPRLDRVRADPTQISQVILNLAVNARDAMPAGGRLTIETAPVILDQAYADVHPDVRPGPHVMLAVSDTGTGMDRETQAHIFEPFFTTKELGKGTGLGLATVFGVVQQAGGSLWVYSEVGHGTTFKIYLPTAEENTGDIPVAPEASAALPTGSATVLLVEDESAVRTLARTTLESLGYTVLEADGGEQALRHCATHAGGIDILVTDLVLPGQNGREIAEQVCRLHPTARVLYMSGYTDDTIVRHGVLKGDVDYLAKPFPPAALARKVAEVLGSRRPPG